MPCTLPLEDKIEKIIQRNSLEDANCCVLKEDFEFLTEHAKDSHYLIYSVTKTFIATAILKIVEERKLRLNDSLEKWFPDIPRIREITIKQLLSHTSGLPDYGSLASYHEAVKVHPKQAWTFEEFLDKTLSQENKTKIGEFNTKEIHRRSRSSQVTIDGRSQSAVG